MSVSVSLCVSVCPRSHLRNYTTELHHYFCSLSKLIRIVGQINETIFQIVIQAPNLACILLLGRFFIKER